MARPINRGYYNYIVFLKRVGEYNPPKRTLSVHSTPFTIIRARSQAESLIVDKDKWIERGFATYHSRRYYYNRYMSIDDLKELKYYVGGDNL